jgi:ABC-type multidrug transport system fused ATPase/permease subunit
MKRWWILKGIKMIFVFLVIGAVMSYLVMSLWNGLMPAIFNLGVITFWQALGILILAKLLFGFGRGGWGSHGHYSSHWKHSGSSAWKEKMEEKLKHLTPEERDKFREEWKRRCGWRGKSPFEEKKSNSEVEGNG